MNKKLIQFLVQTRNRCSNLFEISKIDNNFLLLNGSSNFLYNFDSKPHLGNGIPKILESMLS